MAIVSGCIADVFVILAQEISENFGYAYALFTISALACGITAISKIRENKQILKIYGILQVVILVVTGCVLFYFFLFSNDIYRTRRAISSDGATRIMILGNLMNESAVKTGHMPNADHWCDSLVGQPLAGSLRVVKSSFNIVRNPDIECSFAFNENLSNLSIEGLSGNVVMLFEADGEFNLSGGPELINTKRMKDKYFWPWRQKFIYILFVDSTIVKYRRYDGAVALYDPDKDEFTDYHKKGETSYSPLKWK